MKPRSLRGLWRAREGATAVEFAMVGLPFIALLFAVLELGLIFMASVTLENAVSSAAREIRTGQLKSKANPTSADTTQALTDFKSKVCAQMGFMQTDCNNNLTVDVRTFTAFSNVTTPNPIQNGAFNPGALNFGTGGAGSIVLVRAWYQWPLVAPLLNQSLVKTTGKSLISVTATFRNEPWT